MYYISVPPTIVVRKKRFIAQNQIVKITTIRGGLIAFVDCGLKQRAAGLKIRVKQYNEFDFAKIAISLIFVQTGFYRVKW